MAFPDTAIDVDVELQIGGEWIDLTPLGHVKTQEPITISGGRADEGGEADAATCTFKIKNPNGLYSPRNPLSPHHGKFGRNTPCRVSVPAAATYLDLGPDDAIRCPDTTQLSITGDLDVRVDVTAESWRAEGVLLSKARYTGVDQESYFLYLEASGHPSLVWSTDGNYAGHKTALATVPVPVTQGRQAIRATLDVNNGASGWTVTFYTASSLAGTWVQLGAPVIGAGTTSIFDGTAPVELGKSAELTSPAVIGRYHGAEIRSGIAGTVRANPNMSAQTSGATSFSDTASPANTWTVQAEARLTDRDYRFVGEVSSWPVKWDTSGTLIEVSIEAAGILRRLGQGAKPLRSALYRSISGTTPPYSAWWPLEDAPGATRAAPGYPGLAPGRVSGAVEFTGEAVGGTGGAAGGTQGVLSMPVAGGAAQWFVVFWADLPLDMGTDGIAPRIMWRTPGAAQGTEWGLIPGSALGAASFAVSNATTNLDNSGAFVDVRGRGPVQFTVVIQQVGGGVVARLSIDGEFATSLTVDPDNIAPITSIDINTMSPYADGLEYDYHGSISHVVVGTGAELDAERHLLAGRGYRGETAAARVARLAAEEGVPLEVVGSLVDSTALGPQLPLSLLELLGEAAQADGGTLTEQRARLGLRYRPRTSDYNTTPSMVLDYAAGQVAPSLEPTEDDQSTRNDVTISREGGSSAQYVVEDGPLSVQPPPLGVGRYDEALTLSLASDADLLPQAGWRAHLGTWDEARYPVVNVKLHKHPELITDATACDPRSRIRLTNLPPWLPPGPVDVLADGYEEVIEQFRWTIAYNCVPAGPYDIAHADDEVLGRVDTDGAELLAPVDADDTTLLVTTTKGAYWTSDPAELPLDLQLGGEIVTATAVADGLADQFTRTVSNGWGSTPDGQPWTVYGTASNFSVASSLAQISIGATNTARVAGLALGEPPATDVEIAFTSPASAITGNAVYFYLIGCFDQATFGWYALRIGLYTDGTMRLLLEIRDTGGISTALGSEITIPGVTVAAATTYRARLMVQDGKLRGRLWLASGTEPRHWQIRAQNTTYSGGDVGLQAYVPTGVTNGLPLLFRFDQLLIRNPQKLTVTRSVNGIAKPQAAETDVRLAHPAIIAL